MTNMKWLLWLCLASVQCASLVNAQQVTVDPKLPDYKPKGGVAGKIDTVGSDTMNNLAQLWTEEFKKFYPSVSAAIDAKGSSNAIPALVNGSATFGPMSRDAKKSEIQAFNQKFGYDPVLLPTSIDMVAVYVNRNNPIEGLSFQEIDSIFSSTRKGGAKAQVKTWGQLGASGELKEKNIECYGRNAASGTYGYFKEKVLKDGDFGDWVTENAGSSAVVQSVGANIAGIGYSGIGYRTPNVKPLKLAVEKGGEMVAAEPQFAYDGSYPLARPLYLPSTTMHASHSIRCEPSLFVTFSANKDKCRSLKMATCRSMQKRPLST